MSALVDTFKGMGSARAGLMLTIAAALIIGFILLALRVSTGAMAPLYTGLTLEDSSKIIAELEKSAIPYDIVGNGSQIMVPADRVLRLRMTMAGQGLPSGGSIVGYEIFDRSDTLGSSNFVMNINMMRALEGELSRTIGSLANVESARVHLVVPKREIFTRDKDKPSAAVTIKMRAGYLLERYEVMSISHLVASAVPGLEPSKVTVVDNHGRLLARGEGGDAGAGGSAEDYRVSYETRMQQSLEDLVEKVIGAGKVRVQVAADINFDRVVTNSEKYDPDGQVARSVQSNSERGNSQDKTAKESVSVGNNLPAGSVGGEGGNSSSNNNERTDETTNYEISKTVQNYVSEGGNVKKLSVAVLVDGTYAGDAEKPTYTPRSDDELKQIKTLVSSAIGFDEKRGDKIEVVNMRFTQESFSVGEESFFQRFKLEMQSIIQTLIIAVVAILAILLVLRPAVNQLIKQSQSHSARVTSELAAMDAPAIGRLPGGGASMGAGGMGGMGGGMAAAASASSFDADALIDVANIKGGMRSSTMKKVNEIIDKYPDETMGVLRKWVEQ